MAGSALSSGTQIISRAELYELIWRMTMSHTASQLGVRLTSLRQACTLLEVPTPTSGYWTQKEMGKPVTKPPLPPSTAAGESVRFVDGQLAVPDCYCARAQRRQLQGQAARLRVVSRHLEIANKRINKEIRDGKIVELIAGGLSLSKAAQEVGLSQSGARYSALRFLEERHGRLADQILIRLLNPRRVRAGSVTCDNPTYTQPATSVERVAALVRFEAAARAVNESSREIEVIGLLEIAKFVAESGKPTQAKLLKQVAGFRTNYDDNIFRGH